MGNYLSSYIIGSKNTTYNIESDIKKILMSGTDHSNNESTFYFSLYQDTDSIYSDSVKKSLSSRNMSICDNHKHSTLIDSAKSSNIETSISEKECINEEHNHMYSDVLSSYKTPNSDKKSMSISSFSDSEFSPWNTEYDL